MKMAGKIYTLTTRHEQKMTPVGEPIVPGSVRDQRLPLSYAGAQNAYQTGQNPEVIPSECNLIIAARSTLVRTTHTLQNMLAGAGYNPDAKAVKWLPEDKRIGLECGYDFEFPGLPKYGAQNPAADNYVRAILTECFVPKGEDPRRPVMAALGYALLDSLISGIEEALPIARDGGKVLIAQATHAPIIDALDALLFDVVKVDKAGAVTLEGWPGHYAMGQYVAGTSNRELDSANPLFVFFPKQPSPVAKTLSLDDLKRTRERALDLSQGKF